MKLNLVRYQTSRRSKIGKLSIEGVYQCATLENAALSIPIGTYPVIVRWSEKHQRQVLGICDVPGRSDIEIHIANWPEELLGCVAVGKIACADSVSHSKEAFDELMDRFREPATIEIEEAPATSASTGNSGLAEDSTALTVPRG